MLDPHPERVDKLAPLRQLGVLQREGGGRREAGRFQVASSHMAINGSHAHDSEGGPSAPHQTDGRKRSGQPTAKEQISTQIPKHPRNLPLWEEKEGARPIPARTRTRTPHPGRRVHDSSMYDSSKALHGAGGKGRARVPYRAAACRRGPRPRWPTGYGAGRPVTRRPGLGRSWRALGAGPRRPTCARRVGPSCRRCSCAAWPGECPPCPCAP